MTNRTFAIIKPDAVKNNYSGKIISIIIESGFKILAAQFTRMSITRAEGFYAVHKGKPFFEELTKFMSSGPCWILALEKENAVNEWRKTIGNTNPLDAAKGTIRKLYATSLGENAVHGSDSDENAAFEIGFFFSKSDLIT
ncbi:MAG: nucleoside-diphosphate kinase [Candidatus Neomarinimicrobiota bacterium]